MEGDIAEVDGVIRVAAIRVRYRLKAPAASKDKISRALDTYSKGCPAYLSVKDCIDVRWTADVEEG